ncbi:MAG: hypothetical protein A4E57_02097 [Syntrophorhabdaceae bacterium PtaU1.Bin034]|nr:MAG: hypothetical protein A4E57_02097 [Syntrophorhabdaceae bacterium PtaU1.Bin034]
MRSPVFKVAPAVLSVAEILDQLSQFNRTLIPSIVRLYENLTGKPFDISPMPEAGLVPTLTDEIDRAVMPRLKGLIPDDNGHGRDCHSITVSGTHRFGARGWHLVVELQFEFFYTIALDFLDRLKEKKRTVYPIVRDLLALVLRSGKVPGMMVDEIFEWLCPYEEDAFDDEEDQKVYKRDRDLALARYHYHTRSIASLNEKERRAVLKQALFRFKRLRKKTLTTEQRDLITSLLKLACLCLVKQYEEIELLSIENEENPVENSFGVLWGSQDGFSDWYFEAMNDQWGNSGPPRMRIIIRNRNDLTRVRIILRSILLLQEVWYWHDVLRI